ncbi:hypothetical protein L195_g064294, partial [Trifolium pratense]
RSGGYGEARNVRWIHYDEVYFDHIQEVLELGRLGSSILIY